MWRFRASTRCRCRCLAAWFLGSSFLNSSLLGGTLLGTSPLIGSLASFSRRGLLSFPRWFRFLRVARDGQAQSQCCDYDICFHFLSGLKNTSPKDGFIGELKATFGEASFVFAVCQLFLGQMDDFFGQATSSWPSSIRYCLWASGLPIGRYCH